MLESSINNNNLCLQSSYSEKNLVKPLKVAKIKNCYFWAQFAYKKRGQHGATPKFMQAEITKAEHQPSETFYFVKITCFFSWLMSLFLFCVMLFVKKGSFPAKTAVGGIDKTLLLRLADFGCYRGVGLSEYIQKGKFITKNFFQMLKEVPKSCERGYLLMQD